MGDHNFMIYVLLGILFGFLFLMCVILVCLSSPVVTRYLEARRLLAKAAKYRPAKYKKVSPTTSPMTVSVSALQTLYSLDESSLDTQTQKVPDVFKSVVL